MYVIYKNIYKVARNQSTIKISEIDIKYKTKRITEIICNDKHQLISSNEHLFLSCNKQLYIFGKNRIYIPDIFIDENSKIYLIENYLIILRCHKTIIYNTNTKTIIRDEIYDYNYIDISPAGHLLCRTIFDNEIYDSIHDFISKDIKLIIRTFYGHMYWINDNKIIGFRYNNNTATYFIIDKDIYNEESFICEMNDRENKLNYVIGKKIVCIRSNNILLIEERNVKVINNVFNIKFYNRYYDVFINDESKLYKLTSTSEDSMSFGNELRPILKDPFCQVLGDKLIDDNFIPFCFQYDLWHNIDKPYIVQDIIDVLMECDIFPPEIHNMIYQQILQINCIKIE